MSHPQRRNRATVCLALSSCFLLASCSGQDVDLSTSLEKGVFVPYVADYGVDIFVDEVDGQKTKFGELDRVTVDAGRRKMSVRLEYQPAAGSSLIVGGLGNLLLRAGTNKTFRAELTADVEGGHVYHLTARTNEQGGFDLAVFDETADRETVKQSFALKDGNLERIF